jgi:hypothetical protein
MLRIRRLYEFDSKSTGLSLLAGQNWSLVTQNTKGITPRNELIPTTIDAQYAPGFVWARQPQVRVTENFGNGLWAAVSVELSQTNSPGGTAALAPNTAVTANQQALSGSLFNALNAYSYNHVPDVVAKLAYDKAVFGRQVHVEGFGLYRDFYDRVLTGTGCTITSNTSNGIGNGTVTTTGCTSAHNADTQGGGGGFGANGQIIPGLLDGQVSGLFGKGIGRYGSSQLSDTFEGSNGALDGIRETMLLAGLTLHATPKLDVYGYVGEERDYSSSYTNSAGKQGGYGNPLFSNLGSCEISTVPACAGNTKLVEQATLGFWDKVYSGDFGSFRFGMQYSYTKRESFNGEVAATPLTFGNVKGDDNMIYTSIRYYPFQK